MLIMKKVAVLMGSDTDLPVVKNCIKVLKSLKIPVDVHVMSAHRTPNAATQFAVNAIDNGYGIIIAAAGKAAHLAGVIAANTTLPVIGIPIKSSTLDGLDSLLSTVQMPKGVPVATVAIDGADNAGILAAQILALSEPKLSQKLIEMKQKMADEVINKDIQIQAEVNKI
jgi:5-(carboxyamino)imidazole ribonucleotide mutase